MKIIVPGDDLLWQRWHDVDRLLNEALDQPPHERAAFVRQQASSDAPLQDLVLRLLGRLTDGEERITGPTSEVVVEAFGLAAADHGADDLPPGTAVGPYVIRARHARGGMATVYRAERSDGAYQQEVALKVLRRGLDTEDLIRRFRAERQILSSLTHPNIARLLDGGALPDGRPYLVMELVHGAPITAHADAARLDLRARLRLFLDVVGAVHASHRQLVVHRDIKPSNILVDQEGRVKLLDFGIAKLLEEEGYHTADGARALTPDYASPEQLQGGPITTSTDVYQLGLLLRHLVTGLSPRAGGEAAGAASMRPSRAARLSLAEAPSAVARAEARGTTPARLAKALAGDLDSIVGKALRPDPEDRYPSAEEMAADCRRFLEGRPILAHPESAAYRFRKYVGRHPLFLPGALAVVIASVGGAVVLEHQNRRLQQERDAADASARRAQATQAFFVDIFQSADPTRRAGAQNRDVSVVEALALGRTRVTSELEGEPEVQAALLEAIGRTYTGLGRYEIADTVLRQSLALRQTLYGPEDARLADVVEALGANWRVQGGISAADSLLHEGFRLRALAGSVPDSILIRELSTLSTLRRDLGDLDSAVALADRAVGLHLSAGDTTGSRFTVTLTALAQVLRGANQLDSALTVYQTVLRRQQGDSLLTDADLATTHNNLGYLLRVRKEYPEAERHYREATRLAKASLGPGHPTTLVFGSNLAAVLEFQGKVEEVRALSEAQIAAVTDQWPDGHWRVGAQYMSLGRFLLRNDRPAEAVDPLLAGVRSYIATLGPGHTWTAVASAQHGAAVALAGQPAQGRGIIRRAFTVLANHPVALDGDSRVQLTQLDSLLQRKGEAEAAAMVHRLLEPRQPGGR